MRLSPVLTDWFVRRRYCRRLRQTPFDRFRLRVAHSAEQYEDAFRLVYVGYAFAGIQSVRGVTLRITPQQVLPESTVLVAYEGEQIVGTLTVTADSPAGLPLDRDYPEAMQRLRDEGARLVEYGSLAVVKRCWDSGVSTLLSMAAHHLATRYLAATHCVVGIHPKVVPFYRALFGFRELGAVRDHVELSAPVQGLVQDLQAVERSGRWRLGRHCSGLAVADYFTDLLPPCIELPPKGSPSMLLRWKLPRDVFREMFVRRTDRLATLDAPVREHLNSWRSLKTTRGAERPDPHRPPTDDEMTQRSESLK